MCLGGHHGCKPLQDERDLRKSRARFVEELGRRRRQQMRAGASEESPASAYGVDHDVTLKIPVINGLISPPAGSCRFFVSSGDRKLGGKVSPSPTGDMNPSAGSPVCVWVPRSLSSGFLSSSRQPTRLAQASIASNWTSFQPFLKPLGRKFREPPSPPQSRAEAPCETGQNHAPLGC